MRFIALFIVLLANTPLRADDTPPVLPREAAARMTVPDGFKVTLFAGEPDIVQPIAFTFDDRGRLWVCECLSYPKWHKDPKEGKDRVIILEDVDGDGQFDKRTVFADNLSNLSGIAYGFGGVWLASMPNLIYIPIDKSGDKPGGPAEVKLDGWDLEKAGHNVFGNMKWGPDGWLYGLNGILSRSKVGAPGTPEKDRVYIDCGVWRYHPTRKKFEVFANGTTNPWGLDWNEDGELFMTNCVIAHLWHVVQGGHYERMFGQDPNPHVYGLMKTAADHLHWGGGAWQSSRGGQGVHSEAGGGHAHVGCMIYQGDNWPRQYRGGVFMLNLHGNRVNHDILERNGSTYLARHGKDFLMANDPWFRGIALDYGPDGGVFVTDWYDTGECHNYKVAHKTSGRIFKVTCGKPEHRKVDLAKMTDLELVDLHAHPNEWFTRGARRILQERAAKNLLKESTFAQLSKRISTTTDAYVRHRYLNTLIAIDGFSALDFLEAINLNASPLSKPQLIRWFFENEEKLKDQPLLKSLRQVVVESGANSSNLRVRLELATALQSMPLDRRLDLAMALVKNSDLELDPFLPLMIWYGVEPLARQRVDDALALLKVSQIAVVRENLARGLVSSDAKNLDPVLQVLAGASNPAYQRDVLRGIQIALKGQRSVAMPANWKSAFTDLVESPLPEVRDTALALAVQFGDQRALTTLQKTIVDSTAKASQRLNALQIVLAKQPADFAPVLHKLLAEGALRAAAIRGLAAYQDAGTPKLVLGLYPQFSDEEKKDAIETLTARPNYALALLDAVEAKTVPRTDISNFTVRQMLAFNDKTIASRLEQVWGSIRQTPREKAELLSKFKQMLTPAVLKGGLTSNGRAIYKKTCAACHRLFDDGGAIGPDITGAQRHSLDYLLENILDPSAVVGREFQVSVFNMASGRQVSGIVKSETDKAVTVQTQNEVLVLPKDEIEMRTQTKQSMMPDGLVEPLKLEEVRDLVRYLQSTVQVPLPK